MRLLHLQVGLLVLGDLLSVRIKELPPAAVPPSEQPTLPIGPKPAPGAPASSTGSGMTWTGEIPYQKWMNFYTKVLAKFASAPGLKLTVKVEAKPEGGVSKQKLDETKSALRELGLNDDLTTQ